MLAYHQIVSTHLTRNDTIPVHRTKVYVDFFDKFVIFMKNVAKF